MFRIVERTDLNASVVQMTVEAPLVARAARPGQFVAVMVHDRGERIPLTIADSDAGAGTITLIFQKVGKTTLRLGSLSAGDSLANVLGPLGHPTAIERVGDVVCVAGGVGVAEIYPVARAFKQAGNHVTAVIGARTKDLVILEDKLRAFCDGVFVTTDDGSAGRQGLVTDVLRELLERTGRLQVQAPALLYCIGPVAMMKAVADMTRLRGIRTVVSLNPIMVDSTGMCGACRCRVGGKTVFACVDGPDFDAHEVDFDALMKRLGAYKEQERM